MNTYFKKEYFYLHLGSITTLNLTSVLKLFNFNLNFTAPNDISSWYPISRYQKLIFSFHNTISDIVRTYNEKECSNVQQIIVCDY